MLHHATGVAVLDAQGDFRRARRGEVLARISRRLTGARRRPNVPRTYANSVRLPWRPPRLEPIPVDEIVGALEPTVYFDAGFRPTSRMPRARWERIALAQRRGLPLPPISMTTSRDGYYVVDSRHHVSMARTLEQSKIEAWVTSGTPGC